MLQVCRCLWRSEEAFRSPEAKVKFRYELPNVGTGNCMFRSQHSCSRQGIMCMPVALGLSRAEKGRSVGLAVL